MRNLVYTNPSGTSITLGESATFTEYTIESIDGLGTPDVENQGQRAPYQDGSTWIDSLLESREIVVSGSINYTDLATMYAKKDTLTRAFNPKLGQGSMIYTDNAGSRQIDCVPQITFANKEGTDGFLHYQITFTCLDPYFKSLTPTVINDLPRLEEVLTDSDNRGSTVSYYEKACLKLRNGNYLNIISYSGVDYMIEYEPLVGFSTPIAMPVIASLEEPRLGEDSNGNIYFFYRDGVQKKIFYRVYNGSSWGSEITFYTATFAINTLSVFNSIDGGVYVLYSVSEDAISQETKIRKYDVILSVWLDEVLTQCILYSSQYYEAIQANDGYIYYVQDNSPEYSLYKLLDSQIISELTFGTSSVNDPKIIDRGNGLIEVLNYDAGIPGNNQYIIYNDILIGGNRILGIGLNYILAKGYNDVGYFGFSSSTTFFNIGLYDVDFTTGSIAVSGHVDTSIIVEITGPCGFPTIINADTNEFIAIDTQSLTGLALSATDKFIINTEFGKKSVSYIKSGINLNGMKYLNVGSAFLQLKPGTNRIYIQQQDSTPANTYKVTFYERYING